MLWVGLKQKTTNDTPATTTPLYVEAHNANYRLVPLGDIDCPIWQHRHTVIPLSAPSLPHRRLLYMRRAQSLSDPFCGTPERTP